MILLLSSLLQLLLFFLFRSRYIFGGDSSEFVTVANTWSIAHPPGYPLYSLIANVLRTILPDAWHIESVNILSIVPTIGTSVIIYLLISRLTKSRFVALMSSWFYIFLYPVWLYAEVPEVFALNSFFVAATTYIIIRLNESGNSKWLSLLGLTSGLALAHHQTYIVFLLPWFLLIKDKRNLISRKLIVAALFFLLGISFYAYAPIASYLKPPLDVENASTIDGFVRLVTRASYGTFRSYNGSETNIVNQLLNSAALMLYALQDFRITGLIFIGLGLRRLFKKNRLLFTSIVVAIAMQALFLFYLNFYLNGSFSAAIFERFLIAGYFFCVIPLGVGMAELKAILEKVTQYTKHTLIKKYIRSFFYVFLVMVVVLLGYSNFQTIRLIPSFSAFDNLGQDIFNTLPKGVVLSTNSDNGAFVSSYYYFVKKYRPDIKLISLGLIQRTHYQERTKRMYPVVQTKLKENHEQEEFVRFNAKLFPIFVETPTIEGTWVPIGILWKYYGSIEEANKNMSAIIKENNNLWLKTYHVPKLTKSNSNLIHMRALNDHYINKLIAYVKLLISQKEDVLALKFLLLAVNDYNTSQNLPRVMLMSTYAHLNQCDLAKKMENMANSQFNKNNTDELLYMLDYYYRCDKKSPVAGQYFRFYESLKANQKLPLNRL